MLQLGVLPFQKSINSGMIMMSVGLSGFVRDTCSNCCIQVLKFPQSLRINNVVKIVRMYVMSSPDKLLCDKSYYQKLLISQYCQSLLTFITTII